MKSNAESTPSAPPPSEDHPPAHVGIPVEFPTNYRDARVAIMKLTALDGYSDRRRHLDPRTQAKLERLEPPIIAASQPLEMRGQPLSDGHARMMREIFELMQVPRE